MTIFLNNALPNAWLIRNCTVQKISTEYARGVLCTVDTCSEYDDHIVPLRLKSECTSVVGHKSSAELFSELLHNGATLYGDALKPCISVNRDEVFPSPGDMAVCGLFVPPHRLKEGEYWGEKDFVSNTHWVLVQF